MRILAFGSVKSSHERVEQLLLIDGKMKVKIEHYKQELKLPLNHHETSEGGTIYV